MQPTSDFAQDPNSKAEEPMSKTKEKRDQFLTEIRKKKNQDAINQKRLKFSTSDSQVSENPFILFHMAAISNLPNQATNQGQYDSQLETQLKMCYDKFCEAYNSENWEEVLMVVQALRIAVGEQSSGVTPRMVIEMGIVPNVLSLLDDRLSAVSKLQSEAAWLITNITSGDINDTTYLVEQHTIQILTSCIRNKPQDLQENAIWALANIATETFIDFRNAILDAGALKEVVKEILGPQKRPSYVKIVAWLLKSLLRTPSPEFDKVSISITVLAQFIVYPDEEIQKIAVQSLYYFSLLDDNAKHYVMFAHKLIPKIVSFIESQDLDTQFFALKTAGNLSKADKKITMALCSSGILQLLPNCLECQEQEIRREACYTLSNILADEKEDHDSILDNKIIPLVLNIAQYDTPDMRFEATGCLFNFVSRCSLSEAQMLVSQDILELLLMNLVEDHVKLLRATLDTLYNVLVKGDAMKENYDGMNPYVHRVTSSYGVHLIENLQWSKDTQISDKVNKLMDDFFQTENLVNSGF